MHNWARVLRESRESPARVDPISDFQVLPLAPRGHSSMEQRTGGTHLGC